jgi:signal transduction histidine kinase
MLMAAAALEVHNEKKKRFFLFFFFTGVMLHDMVVTSTNGGYAALWSTPPTALATLMTFMLFPHFPYLPGLAQVGKIVYFFLEEVAQDTHPIPIVTDVRNHRLFAEIFSVFLCSLAVVYVLKDRARASASLEENIKHRRDFLTSITHELRTPISGAIGNIELLKDDHSQAHRKSSLMNNALVCSRSALNLMDRLLDWSKTASSNLNSEWFSLNKLCRDVEAIMGQQMLAKGLVFEVETADGMLYGDESKILQLLTNLMWNAAKYTPKDGSVRLRIQKKEGQVLFEVLGKKKNSDLIDVL